MISNITSYKNVGDWTYIFVAVLIVEFIVIFMSKYSFNYSSLNTWYKNFGILAIGSDVLIILIVIALTRYIYTYMKLNNPLYFMLILVAFQLFHDIVFYLTVIKPIPKGHNSMIDVFKNYSEEVGARILVADALMMIFSILIASLLKSNSAHLTLFIGLVTAYAICYIVYTRNPKIEK